MSITLPLIASISPKTIRYHWRRDIEVGTYCIPRMPLGLMLQDDVGRLESLAVKYDPEAPNDFDSILSKTLLSIKDVSPNFRFLGYPPSPCLPKSTSERLLFGHFLYPPPSPIGETSFMDGP